MTKPLAGRRLFNAMGRRHESIGVPAKAVQASIEKLPSWAQRAYWTGRNEQATIKWPTFDQFVRYGVRQATP